MLPFSHFAQWRKGDPHSEMAPHLAALVQVLLKVTLTSNKIRYLVE